MGTLVCLLLALNAHGAPTRIQAPSVESASAACTAAVKKKRQRALTAFKRQMPKAKKAYFKKVKSAKKRKAFVKRQQAKVKALQRALAKCSTKRPAPPPPPRPPTPPAPPAATPPAPPPATPPAPPPPPSFLAGLLPIPPFPDLGAPLTPPPPPPAPSVPAPPYALVDRFDVTFAFQKPVSGSSGLGVAVNGFAGSLSNMHVTGSNVVAQLGSAAWRDDELSFAGTVQHTDGSSTSLSLLPVVNRSPLGFNPQLAKPAFMNDRNYDPWTGSHGPKTDPEWLRSTGTLRALMLFADFSSHPHQVSPEAVYESRVPYAREAFPHVSYGRMAFEVDAVFRWLRMSRPSTFDYGIAAPDYRTRIAAVKTFLAEAASYVQGEVDFSRYDVLLLMIPDSAPGVLGEGYFRAWAGEGLVLGGKEYLHAMVWQARMQDFRSPPEAFPSPAEHSSLRVANGPLHLFGHFWGLPDLYDATARTGSGASTADQFRWAGGWDVMSDTSPGSQYNAWHKWLLRWLDSDQLRGLMQPGSLEEVLTPLEYPGGRKAIVVPTDLSHAYVVEVRQPVGVNYRVCDRGVLVWKVDSTVSNSFGNAIVQPASAEYESPERLQACNAIYRAPYDFGGGEIPVFEDAVVRVELLEQSGGTYRVRVTRK